MQFRSEEKQVFLDVNCMFNDNVFIIAEEVSEDLYISAFWLF